VEAGSFLGRIFDWLCLVLYLVMRPISNHMDSTEKAKAYPSWWNFGSQ
jgi:hypothetical protein